VTLPIPYHHHRMQHCHTSYGLMAESGRWHYPSSQKSTALLLISHNLLSSLLFLSSGPSSIPALTTQPFNSSSCLFLAFPHSLRSAKSDTNPKAPSPQLITDPPALLSLATRLLLSELPSPVLTLTSFRPLARVIVAPGSSSSSSAIPSNGSSSSSSRLLTQHIRSGSNFMSPTTLTKPVSGPPGEAIPVGGVLV